ncbi:MAG: glycosyltransferase family 4 protein, partial [Gemmatimonadaceae bacterium]
PLGRLVRAWEHNRGPIFRRAVLTGKSISYYLGDRRGFADADRVVAPTAILADQLRALGHVTSVCPPPVVVTVAPQSTAARPRSDDVVRLLSACGDLAHPRKNIAGALDAAVHLIRPGRRIVFEMVGRNAEHLHAKVAGLPAGIEVVFLGPLDRHTLQRHMQDADVLVLPSFFEEWGYVAVEALLVGTPVATYPVYPFASMLAGGLGAVARTNQPSDLARAIEDARSGAHGHALADAAAGRLGPATLGRQLSQIWLDAAAGDAS